MNFFNALEVGYYDNPYHNSRHACDVTNSFLYFLENSTLESHISVVEIVAAIIACLGHDVGHQALTNRFLVNNRDKLALRYNDISVLENMHASYTLKLLDEPSNCFYEGTIDDDLTLMRQIVIEMILATDMSKHFDLLGKFRLRAVVQNDIVLSE
jgi:hypothetical protein